MVFAGHVHNQVAVQWFNNVHETVAFCRVTQMGLLRLITNRKVMGDAVLTQPQAWHTYDQLHQDRRITFLNEPSGLESTWRTVSETQKPQASWTDGYLMAFSKTRDLTFVTFDQAFKTIENHPVVILSS
jgi:toxin-antitoxin system PIN domain toxin